MRAFALFLLCLFAWATSAAATTPDAFRALIWAGDVAGVKAALTDAALQDMATTDEPDIQRNLFAVFTESHQSVADFTLHWLAAEPDSPLAMTARGWQLYATGWNQRGNGTASETYPSAMRAMLADHMQALTLADAAIAADGSLIAASDLLLRLTTTLGNREVIPVELERVMTLRPNRGSLMLAMTTLAPQWGGSPAQVRLLCERYAAKITTVSGYDMQVCAIDAVYSGGFWDGGQRDEAHQLLELTPNPILDYARVLDAVDGFGSALQRQKILEQAKTRRPLGPMESLALDEARAELVGGLVEPVERKISARDTLALKRDWADHDPYNPVAVLQYMAALETSAELLGTSYDAADITGRLKTVLTRTPYAPRVWLRLAGQLGPDISRPEIDLSRIEAAEPYFINAVVYSNYDPGALAAALNAKYWAIVDPANILKARDISGLSVEDRARMDRVVHCPMLRQFRILLWACQKNGIAQDRCGGFPAGPEVMLARLRDVVAEGSCKSEASMNLEDLPYSPVDIRF